MDQIGTIFREARIKAGKEIEDASRETKIAKKYLIAIENEDFDIFPGETYLIGFIRNYAQFLGLDPDEMVIKYKDYKIQEQPVPIEQLMVKPKNNRKIILVLVVSAIFIAAVLYLASNRGFFKREGEKVLVQKNIQKEPGKTEGELENLINFKAEELTKDFKKGDMIIIPSEGIEHKIKISDITDKLSLTIDQMPITVETDENVKVDFDRDGVIDLLVVTNILGEGKVNLTLKKIKEKSNIISGLPGEKEAKQTGTTSKLRPEVMIFKETETASSLPFLPEGVFQVLSSYEKVDIKINALTDSTAYFSYIADDGERIEKLLNPGDKIEAKAVNVLKITAANAGSIKLKINDVEVQLGEKGEVVARIIRWYRDKSESGLYHLVMENWEK